MEGKEYGHLGEETMDLMKGLLKKDPKERISAEEVCKHRYFGMELEDREAMEEEADKVELGQSPILTTANEKRKL